MPSAPTTVVAALVESRRSLAEGSGPSVAEAEVFLARRSSKAGHGGLWELPGGKVESGESAEEALLREIQEELGVGLCIEGGGRCYEAEIQGSAFVFIVFPARFILAPGDGFDLAAHDEWRYFSAGELIGLELAPLDGPALADWSAGARATR
jgi:8-oxo-dGTP diphosphatase